MSAPRAVGLVLAAGAGSRYGMPKGLVTDESGQAWAAHAATTLAAGGCEPVLVVVGAASEAVSQLLPAWCEAVECPDWAEGIGASLRAGLQAAVRVPGARCVVVTLVDLPGLTDRAVRRVVEAGEGSPETLARAVHDGAPGHPVVIGVGHVDGVCAELQGDRGANGYVRRHGVLEVECGDLWDGRDVDVPTSGTLSPQEET